MTVQLDLLLHFFGSGLLGALVYFSTSIMFPRLFLKGYPSQFPTWQRRRAGRFIFLLSLSLGLACSLSLHVLQDFGP
jgi:hypothetical protein